MEEVRATLDETKAQGGLEYVLPSSGLNWSIPALYKRYGFLRRLKEEVLFDLLYYPYWFLRFHEELSWRFFGKRVVEELRIVDGVSARTQKLIQDPESVCERVVFDKTPEHFESPKRAQAGSGEGVAGGRLFAQAVVVRDEEVLARARAHVVPCTLTKDQALEKGHSDLVRDMGKFYNRPLGFWATMTSLGQEAAVVCKPFWIMRSQSHKDRLFVFDASTGLGGVAEYWNVVEYLTDDGGEG